MKMGSCEPNLKEEMAVSLGEGRGGEQTPSCGGRCMATAGNPVRVDVAGLSRETPKGLEVQLAGEKVLE